MERLFRPEKNLDSEGRVPRVTVLRPPLLYEMIISVGILPTDRRRFTVTPEVTGVVRSLGPKF